MPTMLGELIPCGGGDAIPLLKAKLLIGRRSHCDIQLEFPNISSHHCQLEFVNGFWRIQDLQSSNGVKVNGTRVESKWLMPGDVVSVGKHRYEMTYQPAGLRPPEEDEDPFARGLLEKAGLERSGGVAGKRTNGSTPPAAKPHKKQLGADDDEAMKWLSEL